MTLQHPQPADRLDQVLAGITTDLARIHDDIGWAWHLGWDAPAQLKDPTTRGASLARPVDDADQDHVDAAAGDTGLGDHRARAATRTAATHLWAAARHLGRAIQDIQPDAELVGIGRHPDTTQELRLSQLRTIERLAAHRAASVRRYLHRCPRNQRPAGVERHVLAAHSETRRALGALSRALDTGPVHPDPTSPEMCRVCEIRPRAAKSDGRCSTCHSWYHRHGKRERPSALDANIAKTAREAQDRRRARGEDYGGTILTGDATRPGACATTGIALSQVEELRPPAAPPSNYKCRRCRLGHYRPCLAGRCTCDCENP